ncbi:MAG: clostripain-related cysteine peptidase [Anaerolineales bacterium]
MNNSKFGIPALIAGIAVCLFCICGGIVFLYFTGDSITSAIQGTTNPTNNGSGPVIVPSDTSNLPEWTVIVYSDADDDILEEDLLTDINEMELVGSNPQMNIVVQVDRAQGAYTGDGDWTDTRRLYVTQDNDMNHIASQVVENIGEADMGNPQTLVDFVTWSIQNYPAKKYALIMSDHGGGWTGGFSDLNSDSSLTFTQIADSVSQIQSNMGGQKFEVIGFDACLMGMLEVYGSLYPYTNYMVASEEVIPSTGWSYAAWLGRLAQDPSVDGRSVSEAIVSTYIVEDAALTSRASASEISEIESQTTLSAIDSSQMPNVISATNQFISTLANIDQSWVAQGREYTKSYYSIFGEDVPSPFIDLINFANVMATTNDPAIQQASDQLTSAMSSAVIAEKHGYGMDGSNGMSFYFPISDIYNLTEFQQSSPMYADNAYQFLQQSSWDEFLAFHYTGQAFVPQEGQASAPNRASEIFAPGASELTIAPIQLSSANVTGDQKITLNTTVTGNPSYIYFILYYYNPSANAYWVADTSYVFADNTNEVGGVTTPDYGTSPIQVQYEWDPTLFVLKDGQTESFALFEPDEYIDANGVSTYSVYGQYTPTNGGQPTDAKLVFDPDGKLLHIYALPDPDGNGISTAVAISPQIGDTFVDYVKSYYFDENNNATFDYSLSSDVFTWSDKGFWFESRYPVDGQYAIGFYATDFDNNTTEQYEFINYQGK